MVLNDTGGAQSAHGDDRDDFNATYFAGYVVAIGASAGGLDALERLFQGMAVDSGAAFVVIQHLSPDHKSMMANLLGRHTTMPVVMVEDDMGIEANHVYLIPPGSIMYVNQGHLRLTPKNPRGLTLPIDVFFSSLAEEYGPKSIGVILSGTGSDGTRGTAAINEAGGFLIVQDPETAKFDGMPRSAIATGFIDAILPAEAIGARILSHISDIAGPSEQDQRDRHDPATALTPEEVFTSISHLLLQVAGIDFDDYKPATCIRRIERRMQIHHIGTMQAYLTLLENDRNEALTLKRELLIPVTSFFRDTESFGQLSRLAVESIVADRKSGEAIRVWIAGVSTGEEPYSVGMLFLEAFERARNWPHLKIFATDVEQQNIEVASAGSYPESMGAEVSPERLERFFSKSGTSFVAKTELRQCIVFARHNLLTDPPFTKMDLVVCRNTLIYFKNHAQDRALRRLQYALKPGGYLFLGSSESLANMHRDFTAVSAKHKIFKVLRPVSLPIGGSETMLSGYADVVKKRLSIPVAKVPSIDGSAIDVSVATMVRAYSPPSILVNSRHEMVHVFGNVQPYLSIREGSVSLEVGRILIKTLVPVASALLYKSNKENSVLTSDTLHLNHQDESVQQLRICARPLGEIAGERFVLLSFEPQNVLCPSTERPSMINVGAETVERVDVLERELAATRESLQATIEELETSNEELQATNEELMASNEELQSSNEELQSVNEELNTVNAENQEKIEILNRLNADIDSMAKAASIATVFVDEGMRLTRFSPDATHIFKVRDIDVGRRLDDFAHTLEYPSLIVDLQRTLATGEMVEHEVKGASEKIYLVRMLPYRVPSTTRVGAVATFVDITSFHDAERLQHILDALEEHIAVLRRDGTILMVNAAWRRFAEANGDPHLEHSGPGNNYLTAYSSSCDEDGGGQRAIDGVRGVLTGHSDRFRLEYPCHAPNQQRWFVMSVTPISGRAEVVVSHVDITDWRARYEDDTQ